jgi:hypothetical protein
VAVCSLLLFSRVNSSITTLLILLASLLTLVLLAVPRQDKSKESSKQFRSCYFFLLGYQAFLRTYYTKWTRLARFWPKIFGRLYLIWF